MFRTCDAPLFHSSWFVRYSPIFKSSVILTFKLFSFQHHIITAFYSQRSLSAIDLFDFFFMSANRREFTRASVVFSTPRTVIIAKFFILSQQQQSSVSRAIAEKRKRAELEVAESDFEIVKPVSERPKKISSSQDCAESKS